jgi:glycosyltransferase involved in cell wall biosynthesis
MALPLPRRVQRLAGRRADAIVAVSEAVRRSLLHVDPRRVHLVRLPWRLPPRDSIASAEEREGARARLGLPRGRRWVGFFGGLRPAKGVFDVLEAIGCLPEGLAGVHLFVCGPGGDARQRDQAAAAAARLGLQGRVHLLGWVPDVVAALVAADVVVVATRSRLAEALPLVLLDAMACGTPVVASAVGGVAEAIGRDGEAGRLARADDPTDLGRALGEALADANAAAAMAARALRRLRESFDPEAAADRYEDLFRRLGVPLSPA